MTGLMERLDDLPRPAWIALVVVSFVVFWPIGLALLIYLKWSGRMFCSRSRYGQWYGADCREVRRAAREEWRAFKRRARRGAAQEVEKSLHGGLFLARRDERAGPLDDFDVHDEPIRPRSLAPMSVAATRRNVARSASTRNVALQSAPSCCRAASPTGSPARGTRCATI